MNAGQALRRSMEYVLQLPRRLAASVLPNGVADAMSAYGTERTLKSERRMPAFGGKADMDG